MNGKIIYYTPTKNYGFIEAEDGEQYFFFNEKERRLSHRFTAGDEVEFDLHANHLKPGTVKAVITKYIENKRINDSLNELLEGSEFKGYLKKLPENKWMVKHMPSKIFIELPKISRYEVDIEEVYDNRENTMVTAIVKRVRGEKISAILVDRRFMPEYYQAKVCLSSGQTVSAKVTGENDDVIFCTIFSRNCGASILKHKLASPLRVNKGMFIPVKIVNVLDSSIHVIPVEEESDSQHH